MSLTRLRSLRYIRFFFNHPPTSEIYTLSYTTLFRSSACHRQADQRRGNLERSRNRRRRDGRRREPSVRPSDRKSTRLNSSHVEISYAVFCLKKKKDDDASRAHIIVFTGHRAVSAVVS